MLGMEFIAEIRRRHFVGGESISSITRSLQLSRPTVRKHLRTVEKPVYERQYQPCPKLGEFQSLLEQWLKIEVRLPKRQRRTAQRLFEGLRIEGYRGSYDQVQRFVKRWKVERLNEPAVTQALCKPCPFPPELTRVLYRIKGFDIQINDLHSSAFSVRFDGGTINRALPQRYPQSYPQVLGISSSKIWSGHLLMLAFSTDD